MALLIAYEIVLEQTSFDHIVNTTIPFTDEQHLMSNLGVLLPDGYRIHRRFGRMHLLGVFLGGGVAGNLSQLCFYIFHQMRWDNFLPSPKSWGILGDYFGSKAETIQTMAMDKIYTSVYGNAPCIGASAAVCSIIAVETCASVVSLYDKYMELRRRRRMGRANQEWDTRVMQQVLYEVCHLGLVVGIVINDLLPLLASAESGKGIIDSLMAYQTHGIGHAAHLGGFVFGVVYYIVMLSGYRGLFFR